MASGFGKSIGWEGLVSARPSVTAAEAAIKAGGPSNFAAIVSAPRARFCSFPAQQNRFLRRRFAVLRLRLRSPDSRFADRRRTSVLDDEDAEVEVLMSMMQTIGMASDRVMAALVSGLEIEFGRGAGEALAHRFLEAEEVDFHWDARISERWIGSYESIDDDELELDRVRIFGRLDGKWFVAVMIVDGDGNAHGMMGKRIFRREREACAAFAQA